MTMNKTSLSIEHILKLADKAQFQKVVAFCDYFSDLLPKELYQSINKLVNKEADGNLEWRKYLDLLARKNKAKIMFTTFNGEKEFDFSAVEQTFCKKGNGLLRITKDGIEFVTLGDQLCSLSYDLEKNEQKNIVIHFLGSFYSNVNNNFYITLESENENNEDLRFSNNYVALCKEGAVFVCNTKVPKLYTIAINGNCISLYINGVLQIKKTRSKNVKFERLTLKLIGSPGADLSGVMHGIEIWYTENLFTGFVEKDKKLLVRRINENLKRKDIYNLYEIVSKIDDLEIDSSFADRILNLLEQELHKKGFQEWIFNELFQKLSQQTKKSWKIAYIKKLPRPVITVERVTVELFRFPHKRFTFRHVILRKEVEKFNVLENINFQLFPGDILGIIGANGAGKSTLLKTIAGLVPIKAGRILVKGKHLLLSPGLGIRNELTGRENIYLAGCFMGLGKKEVDKLLDEIIEFSELGDAIDKPFKFYSDGMKSRLIFSLATSVYPEILMLDELLSAGDIKFQQKAAKRMDELINKAKVVIIVTHSLSFVLQKCNKVLFLSKGKQIYYGDPKTAVMHYLNELHLSAKSIIAEDISALNLSAMQQIQQQVSIPMDR